MGAWVSRRGRSDLEVIEISSKRLHTWRRVFPLYLEMLTESSRDVVPLMSGAKDGIDSGTTTQLGSKSANSFEDIVEESEKHNQPTRRAASSK